MKPIQSQEEFNDSLNSIAKQTAKKLNISLDEAKKRHIGLQKSGILDMFEPGSFDYFFNIDVFLSIPSKEYKHLN